MKEFIIKMWRGEFSLARAFWVHWLMVQIVVAPIAYFGLWWLNEMLTGTVLTILIGPLMLVFIACALVYAVLSLVGWFRSTLNYKGFILFKILSFIMLVLVILSYSDLFF